MSLDHLCSSVPAPLTCTTMYFLFVEVKLMQLAAIQTCLAWERSYGIANVDQGKAISPL